MIKVSPFKLSDLKTFVNLWNQEYLSLTSLGFKMTYQKALFGFEKKMFLYYGAYCEKELIGFILLKKDENILWIKHLLVDKKWRRKGVGKLLLKKVIDMAKKENLKIQTEVLLKNFQAKEFFIKNGFQILKKDEKENQYLLELTRKFD